MSDIEKNVAVDQKLDQPLQTAPRQEPSLDDLAALYKIEDAASSPAELPTDVAELPTRDPEDQLESAPLEPSSEKTDLSDDSFILGLSFEEQERIKDQFSRLKDIFESGSLSEDARGFFLDADVSAVIAGIKPMSYVQPELEEKKWGFINKNVGLRKADLVALQHVSEQLGILTLRNERLEAERNKKAPDMKNVALMLVINPEKTIDAMRASGAFTEEEIAEFTQDPIEAQLKTSNNGKQDYISAYRVGYQLGYPASDVREFIRSHQLKMKSPSGLTEEEQGFLTNSTKSRQGVSVHGIHGKGVTWVTSNPESPETQQLKVQLEQTFAIQKSVFNS